MMIQLFDAVYLAMLMFHIQRTHHHNHNHIQCTTTDTHQCSHTPYHHDLMSYTQDSQINRSKAGVDLKNKKVGMKITPVPFDSSPKRFGFNY